MPFGYDFDYFFSNETTVTIQIGEPPSQQPVLVRLTLTDNLSNIRKVLESNNTIDDTLSFSKKIQKNDEDDSTVDRNYKFAEIVRENEEIFCLNEIIDKSHNI